MLLEDPQVLAVQLSNEIQHTAQMVQRIYPQAIVLPEVLDIIRQMPRHLFVKNAPLYDAYLNTPLSIGYHQTISQPYIVALMTSLLEPQDTDVVLEIGTGSGYQAAILAELVQTVYTIEVVFELYQSAQEIFAKLHLTNIIACNSNGFDGYEPGKPYDKIIVTASAKEIPPALINQLKIGGKLVIPLEETTGEQNLWLITKSKDNYSSQEILPVKFVPFVNGY